jgi:hypothetical protein
LPQDICELRRQQLEIGRPLSTRSLPCSNCWTIAVRRQCGPSTVAISKRRKSGIVRQVSLPRSLIHELTRAFGVRINTLVPGTTDTALVRRSVGMEGVPDAVWRVAASQWAKTHVPGLQRMATPG